ARSRAVWRDVDGVQPQIVVADRRVAVLQLGARGTQRLDLCALQHHSALQPLDQLVAVGGVAVGCHVARADLALALALWHLSEPIRPAPARRAAAGPRDRAGAP